MESCLGGSDVPPGPGCGVADLDGDGDVDLADYGRLQPQVMGAGAGSGSGSSSPHIVYDFRNLMVRYTDPDTGVVTEYRYDPFGRRIAKIADVSGAPQVAYYFHDGGRVCEERDGTGMTLATYVYGGYVDEVLTMTRGGQTYYFHTDDLYNVTAVTDATGAVVERYEYGDYGQPRGADKGSGRR